jgi:hypothetical protein
MRQRIGSRIKRLEERLRRKTPAERDPYHYATIERMRQTPEGREALEELQRMLAEAETIPADDPARPGADIRAAMRVDSERYIEVVSGFRDYFFAAQEEIMNEQEGGSRRY